jgi:hypothetical protein
MGITGIGPYLGFGSQPAIHPGKIPNGFKQYFA